MSSERELIIKDTVFADIAILRCFWFFFKLVWRCIEVKYKSLYTKPPDNQSLSKCKT